MTPEPLISDETPDLLCQSQLIDAITLADREAASKIISKWAAKTGYEGVFTDIMEPVLMIFTRAQTGERLNSIEIPIQHQDGSLRTVLWNSATIFGPDGRAPVATIAQGQDITLRKKLERENEISLAQIQKNLAQLAILNDEIRNPLTVLFMCADMTEDRTIINIIEEQTRRIDDMVSQLDKRWVESEKVLNMIRKNYHIYAGQESDINSIYDH